MLSIHLSDVHFETNTNKDNSTDMASPNDFRHLNIKMNEQSKLKDFISVREYKYQYVSFCTFRFCPRCMKSHVEAPMMTSSNGNIFRVTGHSCGEIPRSPVNYPHKKQWQGASMFSLICASINGWVNNREAVDCRRHRTHYNVTVMYCQIVRIHKESLTRIPRLPYSHPWQNSLWIYSCANERSFLCTFSTQRSLAAWHVVINKFY